MGQMTMFGTEPNDLSNDESVDLGGGAHLVFRPDFLRQDDADALLRQLLALAGWRQDSIVLYGRRVPLPRLHRWFALSGEPYRWSGIEMVPESFPSFLGALRTRLDALSVTPFNTALANLYRDGRDSVSWHADDEPDLGPEPVIASVSLGASRRFLLRQKADRSTRREFDLTHGSVLVMSGTTQVDWEHCVPKSTRTTGPRVNLTFRTIRATDSRRGKA